jgi:hypothetical protein
MTLFNPIWRVTIGGVQYQTAILANLTITSAVGQTFMSKLKPDTQTLKLSTLINQMLQFKSMIRSPSNCKIRQRHLCQSLVDRLLRFGIAVAEVGSG